MDLKQLCFSLCQKAGTSGDEKDISLYIKELTDEYIPCEIDRLGNVRGTLQGKHEHILLDAHIDQIGMVVRGVDDKGFLLIDKVGGADLRVLTGAEVTVWGKKPLFGVISSVPPHLKKDSSDSSLDIKAMAVDVGLSKQEAESLIEIGDRITLRCSQGELFGDKIYSGSLDDRAGVAAILRALEMTKGKLKNITLSVLFSSQEETGGSGAKTGAFAIMPDRAIAVDVGFGNDPYTDKAQTISLGGGPSIGISPILDRDFVSELKDICKNENIPYQHDVMSGRTGTNADCINITGRGVKTALLSVPLRYMHTGNEIVATEDIENTARLIACYLLKKEAEYNA